MDPTIPELHDQFLLSRDELPVPSHWSLRRLGDWSLATHPSLPVVDVRGPDETLLGWLLGWAVDPRGVLLQGSGAVPSREAQAAELWLYALRGRFAFALLAGGIQRFYLDPCGTLATVYQVDQPVLGSTSTMLYWRDWKGYAQRKSTQPSLLPNQFWPAGLTSDPEVMRLLPNHYLDLQSWKPRRHWPSTPVQRADGEDRTAIDSAIDRVIGRIRGTINAITAVHLAYLPLTAGRDSRTLLACARPAIDRIRFATFIYDDKARKPDIHVARRIARRLRLDHVVIPLIDPSREERHAYLLRTGYAGHWGKARDFDVACRRHLDLRRAWLTGFGGEVGRTFYWRGSDDPIHGPTPQKLVERLNLPPDQRTLAAWQSWQQSVPCRNTIELLDFVYIEQRMGCWAGPHMYGAAPFVANLTPLCDREVLEAMLSLPPAFRREQKLADAIITKAWPELAGLPYQQFTGLRKIADRVESGVRRGAGALSNRAKRTFRRVLGQAP